jgi:hypothetical protein
MNAIKYLLAFGVAPLFLCAAAAKLGAARRSPEQRRQLMRQSVIYALAGLAWALAALCLRT